jgi:hypothetical protein
MYRRVGINVLTEKSSSPFILLTSFGAAPLPEDQRHKAPVFATPVYGWQPH